MLNQLSRLNNTVPAASRASEDEQNVGDAGFERSTIRRVDLHLLPLCSIIYALALIDRTNLGIARAAGLAGDLDLDVGARYSLVSCLYFIPNVLFELPCNLFLRRVGVRPLLVSCIVGWGTVQLSMGFVTNWKILALCRVLLGAFEAGTFPALVFVITTWYRRHEVQKRLALMYMTSLFAGGFSTIFAYALSLLAGKGGLNGWSWIFVIEGAITIVFGLVAWHYLPDFPDRNQFLTQEQTALVLRRIEHDRGDSLPDTPTWTKLLLYLRDWKLWVYGLMLMCSTIPAYAMSFFITSIISSMGWDVEMTLVLCAPPYIFAAISVFLFAWLSDRYRARGAFLVAQTLMTLLGLSLVCFVQPPSWRYVGLFLAIAGSAGNVPGILAYSSNNVLSHSKRAVTTAITSSFGGVGGIVATTIFRQEDAPQYLPGMITTICCQGLLLILLVSTTVQFLGENRKGRGLDGFRYTL